MGISKSLANKLKLGVNVATLAGSIGLMFVPGGQGVGAMGVARTVATLGAGFALDKAGEAVNKSIDKHTDKSSNSKSSNSSSNSSSSSVNARGRDVSSTVDKASKDLVQANAESTKNYNNDMSLAGLASQVLELD